MCGGPGGRLEDHSQGGQNIGGVGDHQIGPVVLMVLSCIKEAPQQTLILAPMVSICPMDETHQSAKINLEKEMTGHQ